jgi:hypothetical protein
MRTAHLPDDNHVLLLKAGLSASQEAVDAWSAWQSRTRWETEPIDEASVRMLPLVYASLSRIDPSLPGLSRLRGWHRRSWLENRRLVHLATPGIRSLVQAGHRVMVLKGTALTLRYYDDPGGRSMKDVDLLVHEARVFDALDILETHGWTSAEAGWAARDLLKRHHGVGLSLHGNSRGRIDLHRRLLADSHEHADEPLWERADPVAIGDVPVYAPCTADELLLVCIHGWQWQRVASIRWIADAITLTRHMRDDAAWTRLIAEARRRQVALRLSRALRLLVDHFSAAIPPAVVAELEAGPFAPFEDREADLHTRPPGLLPPGLPRAYFAQFRSAGPPDGPAWWFACARRFWASSNAPAPRHLAPWLMQWARRRVRAHLTARSVSDSLPSQ